MLNIKSQDSVISAVPNTSDSDVATDVRRKTGDPKGTSRIYSGMWGKPEIIAVAIGGAAVAVSAAVFAFVVWPQRTRLESAKSEKAQLEQQVVSARQKYGKITSTTEQVSRLVASADTFESNYLPLDAAGQTALYQRINSLIATHGLINTAGPEYSPLPVAGQSRGESEERETGRERYRSIFPGVYVTMTVDGTYPDIRRFISDIETSDQFVIISAVGIEPAEQRRKREDASQNEMNSAGGIPGIPGPVNAPASMASPSSAVTRGETVSLKIELAAYFRRSPGEPARQQ